MDGESPRKRKRLEQVLESNGQYHLAKDDGRGDCSKRACIANQELSDPGQGVLGVRQLTVDARTGSVQSPETAHLALFGTSIELSVTSCKHECPKNIIPEQVCFGMVSVIKSCQLLPPVTRSTPIDASSLYVYSLTAFLFSDFKPTE